MQELDDPIWATIREAADRKKVSTRTIRRWIDLGILDAERVGPKLIRVRVSSLEAIGKSLYVGADE